MSDTSPPPDDGPTGSAPLDPTAAGGSTTADPRVASEVRNVVETAIATLRRAGTSSATTLSDAVESAGQSLSRRVVERTIAEGRPVRDPQQLAHALARRPDLPLLANATGAALAARTVSRFGPLRFLARRTPMWLLAGAAPAAIASVSRGAEELSLVAGHLAARARADGVQPDPERVRRAAVQVLSGAPVEPDREPRHGSLAVGWLWRATRAALPFSAGVRTKHPDRLASAAAAVDTSLLA